MKEITVENALVRGVRRKGGLIRKYVTPGRKHAPDRIVIVPGFYGNYRAAVVFVELKKPRKKPRAGQEREHQRLRAAGCHVEVIDTLDDVEKFLEGWF
jgi:hypothetical protein